MIKPLYSLILFCFFALSACGGSGSSPQNNTAVLNQAPLAISDSYTIDSNVDLPVLDNDSDPDGDNFSISLITQPINGSAEIINASSIRLTIDQDFIGNDELTYTITDTNGASSTAIVQLSLNPAEKRPVANNDRITGITNTVLQIDVLQNDTDDNGDTLTIISAGNSQNGSVSVINAEFIQYIPNSNFSGQDEFTYTISDGIFEVSANVSLYINEQTTGGNSAPVANSDQTTVLFETTTLIDVLANDIDFENEELVILEIIGPDHGSALIRPISRNGVNVSAIEYTPDSNYTGLDSLIYIISDGNYSVAGTLVIDVRTRTANIPPRAVDDYIDTGLATQINLQPFANDTDPEGDALIFVEISEALNGVYSIDNNNTPNNLSDDVLTYIPDAGYTGTEVLVYTLSDGISQDRGVVNIFVSDVPVSRVMITGSVHKGAVSNSVVSVHPFDRNGIEILTETVVAASTELDGSWIAEIPQLQGVYMASAQGGQFIDEAEQNLNAVTQRLIQLSNEPVLQSMWSRGQSHISLTPYTSTSIRKARYESNNNFSATMQNNIIISEQAMGFNPFSLKPAEPLAPSGDSSSDSLRYALNLGGFANAMNANATELDLSLPTTALIDAVIDDLADCVLDAKFFGNDVLADSQFLIDVTDINPEIRRFGNNNFSLYPNTTSNINISDCQQSGEAEGVASITLTNSQSSSSDPIMDAGDIINYTITLVNDGTLDINNVLLTSVLSNGSIITLSSASESLLADNILSVGETWVYTSSYVVTQFDIDAGLALTNIASVVAAETGATPLVSTAVTVLSQNPEFILTNIQTSGPNPASTVGDILVYTTTITNIGNVSLTGIEQNNTLSNGLPLSFSPITESVSFDGILQVGEMWTYTTTYTVTQADIDSGLVIINTASVDSNETDFVNTPVSQSPSLLVSNTALSSSDPVMSVGDVVNFTVGLLNNGNLILNSLTPTLSLSNGVILDLGNVNETLLSNGFLDVGETWIYTTSYVITQLDIDAGLDLISTASVVSTQIGLNPITDIAVIDVEQSPTLSVLKSQTSGPNPANAAGDNLTYRIVVSNTGNINLNNIIPSDTLSNGASLPLGAAIESLNADGVLEVGEEWIYTTSYRVTQADIDLGEELVNSVTVNSTETSLVQTSVTQAPSFLMTNIESSSVITSAGEVLTYTININNNGNISLNGVVPVYTLSNGGALSVSSLIESVNSNGILDVGESWTIKVSYVVTQADIDIGRPLISTVSVTTDETDAAVIVSAEPTELLQSPELSITVTADLDTVSMVSDVISYTYQVTNDGNVTLTNLSLFDTLSDETPICDSNILAVAPNVNSRTTCTAIHTVLQSELDSFSDLINVVTASSNEAPDATASELVSFIDVFPPVLTLVGIPEISLEAGVDAYIEQGATATDFRDGDLTGLVVIGGDLIDINSPGIYILTYNVSDAAGNSAIQIVRTVTVQDTRIPVLTLVGANPQLIEAGTAYTELTATALDNIDGDISTSIVTGSSTVDTSTPGTYAVTYDVVDAAGNAATQVTRTVTVQDTTIPVISLVGANPQIIEAGIAYAELTATALDNIDGDITASIVTDASAVDTNVPGTYTVTYDVMDDAGNPASQVIRTVTVQDTTIPVITLVGENPQIIEAGTAYNELTATALDNINGDISTSIVTDSSTVDTTTPGTYTVTYDVVDVAGNVATQVTRTVTVKDTTIPVISLAGANPQVIEAGIAYIELTATALDNIDGDITALIVIDSSTVDTNVPGTYTVTYDVTDAAGNPATQVTRTVAVQDTIIPVITLTGINPQVVVVGTAYRELSATALDNIDGDISVSIVIDSSAVDSTILGSYLVTYDVSDTAGNSAAQVTRTVNVVASSLTDSDSDGVSDIIESALGSDINNPNPVLFVDVNGAAGDGSSWANSTSTIPVPVPGNSLAETFYILIAENSDITTNTELLTNCDNIAIIGSMQQAPIESDPALVVLNADDKPTTGLIVTADTNIEIEGCKNLYLGYLNVSGGIGGAGTSIAGGINISASATVTLETLNIKENSSSNQGAGIFVSDADTEVTIRNSYIDSNSLQATASGLFSGAGISIIDGARVAITNTEIINNEITSTDNTSALSGAGVSVSTLGTELTLTDSLIENNTINSNSSDLLGGAGVSVVNRATLNISNSRILNNVIIGTSDIAHRAGAGIRASASTVVIDEAIISGNQTPGEGGGIFLGLNSDFTLENSILSGNSSTGSVESNGGAIYLDTTTIKGLEIANNLFLGNEAFNGGAIYQTFNAIGSGSRIFNNTMLYNQSRNNGGAYYLSNGQVNFINNLSKDNLAGAVNTEDYFFGATVTSGGNCSHNGFANDPLSAACDNVNNIPTNVLPSPIADRGYYLRTILGQGEDDGIGNSVDYALNTRTTNPSTGSQDTGVVDLGYHYAQILDDATGAIVNPQTDFGQNVRSGGNSSILISPIGAITAGEDFSFIIQPIRADGLKMAKANAVFFKVDTATLPAGLTLIAPTTTAGYIANTDFIPMIDRGDGSYEIKFSNTGAVSGTLTIQVLSNPSVVLPTDFPETFNITLN